MSVNKTHEGAAPGGQNRYLTVVSVWALAFGCAVGWGAFAMPGNTFLPAAGPLGTAIGMGVGAVVMALIGINYSFLIQRFPENGGTLTFAAKAFGYDHGFLSSWFLILVYVGIMWANATAITLFFRNLFPGVLQFGFHYQVFGYDVYFGEALVSVAAILAVCLVSMYNSRFSVVLQSIFALVLFFSVAAVFAGVFGKHSAAGASFAPQFSQSSSAPDILQIFHIVVLTPWAFVGFESVSHSVEGFRFDVKKTGVILLVALITSTIAYVLLNYVAAALQPAGYANWAEYISDLGNQSGHQSVPTVFAAFDSMGNLGAALLGMGIATGILTGMIGNLTAASRLLRAMSQDDILPAWFGKLDRHGNPRNAVFFLMLLSLVIPFLGRTAITWIVDVNTIGAVIAYGYTSAAAFYFARKEQDRKIMITGCVGLAASLVFFLYFMAFSAGAMSTESYLILALWGILGFVYFRFVFKADTKKRFGKSIVVWVCLLFLIFFTTLMWVRQATDAMTRDVVENISEYYQSMEEEQYGQALTQTDVFLEEQMSQAQRQLNRNSTIQMALIIGSLAIMFSVYNSMSAREKQAELEKVEAQRSDKAKSTFLSNMSHDIRTPMNAIIGYVGLLKKDESLSDTGKDYLSKIEASSDHLLALINDVLEMSRIESGKMELAPEDSNLVKALGDVYDLFATQMREKGITYRVDADQVTDRYVFCDTKRLNRVLLNLISNAYKFTPSGGSVTVTLTQSGTQDGSGVYQLRVKDTGMGMSPEFAAKVFEAYERERTAANIQGTGLGMAITKSIVDLMGGDIRVETEQGKGTQFIIDIAFPLTDGPGEEEEAAVAGPEMDFTNFRLLLVEDNEINREIATLILEEAGFQLDTAENGQIAVDKVKASRPGDYQVILMDVQMPVMDGYDATRAIRALDNKELASVPIIAMTANAFAEDVQAAKDAGMNSHISKPIDVPKMLETLAEILR